MPPDQSCFMGKVSTTHPGPGTHGESTSKRDAEREQIHSSEKLGLRGAIKKTWRIRHRHQGCDVVAEAQGWVVRGDEGSRQRCRWHERCIPAGAWSICVWLCFL